MSQLKNFEQQYFSLNLFLGGTCFAADLASEFARESDANATVFSSELYLQ